MKELLFEIGTEEIPARLVERARAELEQRVLKGLDAAGLAHGEAATYATPRRLAIVVETVERQADRREELTGPPASVAFDAAGQPTKAALGFAARNGVDVEALTRKETPRGEYLAVVVETRGKASMALLPGILASAVAGLKWPKSMRWGAGDAAFIRPVHWLVALFGGEVLPLSFAGIDAGRTTRGHRFMAPEPFDVATAAEWLEGLRRARVEPDSGVRREIIRRGAEALTAEIDCQAVVEPGLLEEVANLVEWPVPLLGSFDESYLDLPEQVLVTPMKHHQRYFPVLDREGRLAAHFVLVAGLEPRDPDVVVRGNGYVLRARLADARFFFDQDRKTSLDDLVAGLEERTFIEGLGTMRDKASRLEALAGLLAGELAPDDSAAADTARRAGYLAKADLSTEVVGEFPELQGEMGRDYALLAGEDEAVARAIYEHYLPRFAGDRLPESRIGAATALADKLDTIVGCFALGLEPTGSADPYALRRSALGVARIVESVEPAPPLSRAIGMAIDAYGDALGSAPAELRERVLSFFRGRMKASLSQEYPTDLVEAVLTAAHDEPGDVRGRLEALVRLKETDGWDDLALAVKRVVRIAGETEGSALDPERLADAAERALFDAYDSVRGRAEKALETRDYPAALEHLIGLKPAIDRFFDDVLVMSEVDDERERRLALLGRVASLFHRVADFDKVST